jgi:transposase
MNLAEHECPRCGSKTSRVHDYRIQLVKDIDAFGSRTILLPRYHRSTVRLNAAVVSEMASVSSVKSIATRYHILATTVTKYFDHVSYCRPHLPTVLSLDMSPLFRDVASACFKNAMIIADKYHVTRQVTWAFERIRVEVQQQFHQERRKYFKRSRSLLLKRFKNLTADERLQVEAMLQVSEKLRNAYMLKEKFYDFMFSKCFEKSHSSYDGRLNQGLRAI